ncbi:MAG: hypothetical protein Q8O22_00665 [Candidatus Omnitrophota bacterium]|nr:hypothetical protein [Candidatus Omnitrophota bacterium]
MKKNIAIALLAGFFLLNIGGCVMIVGGTMGAAGAYAASRDTIEGDTDKSYASLWREAVSIAESCGAIKQEDADRGYIEVDTAGGHLWIRIARLTRHANRLKVSARNSYHLPDIAEAQRVYTRIIEGAK